MAISGVLSCSGARLKVARLAVKALANRSEPFRVEPEFHLVPGAVPTAIHVLPFQGNRNESATSVAGEKYGLRLRFQRGADAQDG